MNEWLKKWMGQHQAGVVIGGRQDDGSTLRGKEAKSLIGIVMCYAAAWMVDRSIDRSGTVVPCKRF